MSSVEERLVRDIEAVTGGVVVTDTDLDQAREQLDARIGQTQRRGRRRAALGLAAVAAVAAGIVGVVAVVESEDATDSAPADSSADPEVGNSFLVGRAPTRAELQGVWRVDNGVTTARFSDDGEVAFDTRGQVIDGDLRGTYRLAGNRITLDLGESRDPDCRGEAELRVSLPSNGEMRVVHAAPLPSGDCAPEQGGVWVLEHLLPTAEEFTEYRPPELGDYGPLRRGVLPGFWLLAGGGHGLQLTPDGTYSALDDSGEVIEDGRWRLDGDELSLTADTTGCRIVLGDTLHINPGTDMLRGELTEHRCEMPWVSGDAGDTMEWVQIPDRTSE